MFDDFSDEDWFTAWGAFLAAMLHCALRKRDALHRLAPGEVPAPRTARMLELHMMLHDLLEIIRAEITREVTDHLLADAQERHRGRELVALTGQEMRFVARHYGRGGAERQSDGAPPTPEKEIAESDTGFEAAKTAKDSIEKLFSWVPRHRALLHGLNELLSLGKLV
ncbi:hypothetical protein FDP22_14820 [Paroceanicella profunda]|uniref:Uncharacterized protein n=1 Tax=Paroceanicella profunda TaxID=2579971 RepID=A0A5B8G1I7_9RHOB|nr:hypothetical protein [Paroceanicella profunda]QDL92942.1 hypothetical protein FDP22_14820 [Paroceanicella profunda]